MLLNIGSRDVVTLEMNKKMLLAGMILLVVSLVWYFYTCFILDSAKWGVMDGVIAWFHQHVIQYIRSGGDLTVDAHLRFVSPRNLLYSPILVDRIVAAINMVPGYWTLIAGTLFVVMVFLVSIYVFRNGITAGLAAILFATTPGFVYWFKYNNYGDYTLQFLWLIAILVIGVGIKHNNKIIMILGSIVGGLLWVLWSGGWVTLLVYAGFLSLLIYTGKIKPTHLVPAVSMLIISPLFNIISQTYFITFYHVLGYTALAIMTIVSFIEYRIITTSGPLSRVSWRLIGIVAGAALTVAVSLVVNQYGNLVNYPAFIKPYELPLDLGVLGVLSLLAFIVLLRGRILGNLEASFTIYALFAGFIIGLLGGFVDHTMPVFTVASIAPLVAYSIYIIASFTLRHTERLKSAGVKAAYIIGVLWILVGSVVAGALPSYMMINEPPRIYYGDLTKSLIGNATITNSPLIQALDFIKENTTGDTLVICYWGYSYWVVGYISNAYTIADPDGTLYGKRLISWFFMSDEYTAINLIKQIIGNRKDVNVYVVVAEALSIEKTMGASSLKLAYIGRVIPGPRTATGEQPLYYQPVGDIARIPTYISGTGKTLAFYLDTYRVRSVFEVPLAWNNVTEQTMVVRLILNAIKALGYQPINGVLSEQPITNIPGLKFFKLEKVFIEPLYNVTAGFRSFQISYMVAVYKAELP